VTLRLVDYVTGERRDEASEYERNHPDKKHRHQLPSTCFGSLGQYIRQTPSEPGASPST
jgi:hypothetical protein